MIRKGGMVVLMLVLMPMVALAQNTGKLTGVVTDAATGDPLPGANVVLEGIMLGAATNTSGEYTILGVPVGTYDIRASFVGYQPVVVEDVEINSGYTRQLDFELNPGRQLDEIVVEYERPIIQNDAIGAPRVVSGQDIENLPVRSVVNVASLQAGVVASGDSDDLFIRGGRDEEVAYYVDGVKVTGSSLLGLNQQAIQEQEMLIGTIPARYGDVQSGVISVTTKSGGSEFFGAAEAITSELTDPYGYNLGALSLGGPIVPGWASFFVSGQYTDMADENPYGVDTYQLTDGAYDALKANPQVVQVEGSNGDISYANFPWQAAMDAFGNEDPLTMDSLASIIGLSDGAEILGLVNAPDTYVADSFAVRSQKDRPFQEMILNGSLTLNPIESVNLRIGGGYERQRLDERGFQSLLYNRDMYYHDERDSWRLYGSYQQRLSDDAFFQVRVGYQDFSYVQYPNGFSTDVEDAFNYGDIDSDYLDVASRYFTLQDTAYTPLYTSDGTAGVGSAISLAFDLPGAPLATYQQEHETSLQVSANASWQVGRHQLEIGGEYQQITERWYSVAGFGLSRYAADGDCEQQECYENYGDLPYTAFEPRVTYWGYDFRGLNEVDDQDIDAYFTVDEETEERLSTNVAPYQPIYYAGYLQDKVEYGDLVLNLGLRVDVFDNNTQVLKDVYAPVPIERAGILEDRPAGVGDDYAVYYNDAGNIVGYRDLDGDFYDVEGARVAADQITNDLSGQVQPTDEARSAAFEDYEPQVTFMPRIGVSFPVTNQALFFASYNVLSQRPTEEAFTSFTVYDDITTQDSRTSNPSLKPEKTTQYELGFRQRLGARTALTISGFYRTQENKISNRRLIGGFPSYGTYLNADFTTTKGVEVGFDLRRTNNVAISANYTLAYAQGTGSDAAATENIVWRGQFFPNFISPADFDQRHTLNATFDYRLGDNEGPEIMGAPVLENFGVNVLAQYGSGMAYTALSEASFNVNDSFTSETVGTVNSARLPATYRLDLQVDRRFNLGFGGASARAYLTVLNLLNTENVLAVYRATGLPDQDGYLQTTGGRSFINSQPDPAGALFNYGAYTGGPVNIGDNHTSGAGLFYGSPRRIRLGMQFNF